MTRTALVNATTHVVDNVIAAGPAYGPPDGYAAVASDAANIGDSYDGATFTPPAAPPPTAEMLVNYAKRKQQAILAAGITVNVAASGSSAVNVLSDGTNETRADLSLLAQFGQLNPTGTKTWLDNNGVVSVLTGTQLVTLATLVGDWIANTYPALADIIGKIASGSIATRAQIDVYAWPAA